MRLYNTLSRTIEALSPLEPGKVKVYCCGPTVYNYQHLGNLRTYVFEDLLVRVLRYASYSVKHVMNITDVGHLVSDADEGEDKMALASKREQKSSHEIAEFYTKVFLEHSAWLNIKQPDIICKATDHIPQMIALIKRLEAGGFAYQSGGNVYFDVARFPDYGKLAQLNLEALKAGARIDVDERKKHPLDFALWFTKSKFENQELQWDSPWGRGYPGWHIECSAMSMSYLGEQFDIHCGGIDHIPVHHTNEIAQSEAATGKQLANIWLHGGFLLTDKEKMSKSKGEFLTLDVVRDRGFEPLAYRLFCLAGHYRRELQFSWEALSGAQVNLEKWRNAVLSYKQESGRQSNGKPSSALSIELETQFRDAVFDDLGLARALAVVHRVISEALPAEEKLRLLLEFDQVLGLGLANWEAQVVEVPKQVQELVSERERARKEKRWKDADILRDQIGQLGFVVEDKKEGAVVRKR